MEECNEAAYSRSMRDYCSAFSARTFSFSTNTCDGEMRQRVRQVVDVSVGFCFED